METNTQANQWPTIARAYWDAGLTPLPRILTAAEPAVISTSGEPHSIAWGQYKAKQPEWSVVHDWFSRNPVAIAGIALLTGSSAHPLAAHTAFLQILDLETSAIFEAWHEELLFLGHANILHLCVIERTPSGGAHVGFLCRQIGATQKISLARRASDNKILVELLQHQPCTVAPTAMAWKPEHPPGACYALTHGDWAIPQELSGEQRQTLVDCARGFNEVPEQVVDRSIKTPDLSLPGNILNAQADAAWWEELLLKHDWRDVSRAGLRSQGIYYFQRPGKVGGSPSATYGVTGQYLYVFTSNAPPFEEDKAYSAFSAYALLEHAGNFQAAARSLAGKKQPPVRPPAMTHASLETQASESGGVSAWDLQEDEELVTSFDVLSQEPPPASPVPAVWDWGPEALQTWALATPIEKLAFILEKFPARAWSEEATLQILAGFYPDAVIWMRIKAQAKTLGVNTWDLDRACKTLQPQPARVGWQPQRNGTHPPSSPPLLGVTDWRYSLLLNGKKEPAENAGNLGLILANHPEWAHVFWWDTVRALPMVHQERLSDTIVTEIAQWLCLHERMPARSLGLIERVIIAQCQKTQRDLLQEWLLALPPWDGTPRLREWLHICAKTDDSPYGHFISLILPVSMVARAREPGCLYRYVVILEGPEEWKKSTLVHDLATKEWLVELSSTLDTKEAHMMLAGAWVAELPELDTLTRTEEARLKAFITMRHDAFVPKYSNNRVTYPRRTIFIGTTNPEGGYLKGQTGNTRFLPITVKQVVDVEYLRQEREQIFAEALLFYETHPFDWWAMPGDAAEKAKEQREERRVRSIYEDDLETWLTEKRLTLDYEEEAKRAGLKEPVRDETSWAEIAHGFLRLDTPERWKDIALQRQIGAALRSLGWESRLIREGGDVRRVWKKSEDEKQDLPPF